MLVGGEGLVRGEGLGGGHARAHCLGVSPAPAGERGVQGGACLAGEPGAGGLRGFGQVQRNTTTHTKTQGPGVLKVGAALDSQAPLAVSARSYFGAP